jgi:hypothetical protein
MYRSTFFLTSALDGGEWSASGPSRFTPGERALRTHCIGGWVGLRTGLEDVEDKKFLTLPRLEIRPLGRQPSANRYTDFAIPTPRPCVTFRDNLPLFKTRDFQPLARRRKWIAPSRFWATTLSIYSHLPSVSEGISSIRNLMKRHSWGSKNRLRFENIR